MDEKKKEIKKAKFSGTKKEAFEALDCFRALMKIKLSAAIKMDIGCNVGLMRFLDEGLEAAKDHSSIDGFDLYQDAIRTVTLKYAKNGQISGAENVAAYEQDLQGIRDQYPNVADALNQKEKDFNEGLKETIEIDNLFALNVEAFKEDITIDITPIIQLMQR